MISAQDAVEAVGAAFFEVLVPRGPAAELGDVFLAEPGEESLGQPGDLVLGVGVGSTDSAVSLVERCAASRASGVVLRSPVAGAEEVRAAAEAHGLLLVGLRPEVAWAHVVWLLRGVIDRAAAPGSPVAGDAGVHNDLFVLADAAAAIVDAPVTIEDSQSRVLAYSSGQGMTDPARVSTIVGRRVPPEVVAHFRAQGVFRRLAQSSEPFLVPGRSDGTLPRLVVPVRAGDQWLGSIWAVVDGPVADDVLAELSNAASVLALHLLRLQAQANVARRDAVERLRNGLRQFSPGGLGDLTLPAGPWRVVALTTADADRDPERQVDVWTATCRRHSWAEPLIADVDGFIHAVVTEATGPGSWRWLQRLVIEAHAQDPTVAAAAGAPASTQAELPRSRREAVETLALIRGADEPVLTFDDSWARLTLRRAASAVDPSSLGGPLFVLIDHDATHGTRYVDTVAAWLAYPGEPQRAAEALHVHPNTLRHRMKRIDEVADLDLRDPGTRLALQLQIEAGRIRR